MTSLAERLGQPELGLALSYVRRHLPKLFWALFWRGLYVLVPMQVPILTGAVVDALSGNRAALYGWTPESPLNVALSGLFVVALLYGVSSFGRSYARALLSRAFVTDMRKRVFDKLAYLSLDVHQHYGTGELLERTMSDTGSLRRFTERVFIQSITNVLRVFYPVVMLLVIEWRLALIVLAVLPVQTALTRFLQTRLHASAKARRETRSELTTRVKEGLDGIETVKAFHAEEKVVADIERTADRLEDDELRSSRLSGGINGVVWGLTNVGLALSWWQGSQFVLAGDLSAGRLVAFTGFVVFAYAPFRQFARIANTYQRGRVSLARLHDLLSTPSSVMEAEDAKPLRVDAGAVQFEGVSFRYANQTVLDRVDLRLEPTRFTALVGRSGSGKSSLLRLIARLYDPTRGRVEIDGQTLSEVTLASLRAQVAVVPQHALLFNGTLRENVTLSRPDATGDEIWEACEAVHAAPFIRQLERGLDTRLGREGGSLSGGEKQRVALARALLSRPKILLLDEPTSALDAESEAVVTRTLKNLSRDVTVIVVGHRLNTVRQADHILVMDEGRIVDEGSFERLAETSEVFNTLFNVQKAEVA